MLDEAFSAKINMSKEFSLRASFLAILRESGLNSTGHGLPNAVRGSNFQSLNRIET